jgi:hypothetical protein
MRQFYLTYAIAQKSSAQFGMTETRPPLILVVSQIGSKNLIIES